MGQVLNLTMVKNATYRHLLMRDRFVTPENCTWPCPTWEISLLYLHLDAISVPAWYLFIDLGITTLPAPKTEDTVEGRVGSAVFH
ncbi:hypothetical protein LTR10_021118 [Elasticomyces elasticus]|uniref:Uncharacterized protein n=1 Tax=Exophiala sideris TaxID=1016849 RepID=A0ABR0JRW8_9EURO|nr:hypothetical protein LTR10_021118 [Elasticomyces elasticus]KAK5040342.1 hypothetical protein LTS07_000840 [Exophiala sideris]KAK5043232.1 hypothetical protein LTR13_001003 [Exophiala sideris]KAK5068720.1 hypothetical protein LTR69_000841 [Exophiala sideris]KAK5186318.1 hypothetical protein LTR44_001374 [Eurotiomycetes sp. CCFEE 6388]